MHAPWEFWIDVGGTFTDCIGRRPDGVLVRHKLLSSGITPGTVAAGSDAWRIVDDARRTDPPQFWNGFELRLLDQAGNIAATSRVAHFDPQQGTLHLAAPLPSAPSPGQRYELCCGLEAPVIGIRWLLACPLEQDLPPCSVRLGTTRGTNALLTRRGARTALVITKGFADALHIGYQNRPRLFDLDICKPQPLFEAVIEADERLAADGTVLRPLDEAALARELAALRRRGIASLAICLLHAARYPRHEQLAARLAQQAGFEEISVSHAIAPMVKLVTRAETTVLDAYLNPVLRAYVASLRGALGASRLRLMTSAGGLVAAEQFTGKDSILSGPAGGVVGFSRVAQAAGFERAIGFDMGGTSTDVARFDGRFDLEYETEKAGVRIAAAVLAIETVAAGGGSICRFDGVKLAVGPDSAGADPGPACYGRGGPLALTDVNLHLGKIRPEFFPIPLDPAAAESRLHALAEEVAAATGRRMTLSELCEGLLRVANTNMVRAIQRVSLAKGYHPRDYVLVAFGGAAGQHACAVARELGIERVLCHADAGLLSAYGMGMADVVRHRAQGIYRPLHEGTLQELEAEFARLADEAVAELAAEGFGRQQITLHRLLDLRYRGLESWITIPEPSGQAMPDANRLAVAYAREYERQHHERYGYHHAGRPIELVALRIEAVGLAAHCPPPSQRVVRRTLAAASTARVWFVGRPWQAALYRRAELQPGDVLHGPAIVNDGFSTTVIDPGWQGVVYSGGELVLEYVPPAVTRRVETGKGAAAGLAVSGWRLAGASERWPTVAEPTDPRATDAGTTDVGTTDAGTTDAGASDAGASDAGASDARAADTGGTEAAPTEAGVSQFQPPPGGDDAAGAGAGGPGTGRPMVPEPMLQGPPVDGGPDPVWLEVFNHHFAAIAEQMGITLRNTASSVNVKERLDFSCALFTARGELVVNAPHIPVHLGAMGETVRQVLRDNPGLSPGDVVVTNDPYHGGSHLPDVTVVTPVHDPASGRLLFFTASRAHHAELGGIVPGSMPPFSRSLAEEGVLICNFKLVEAGRSRFDELRALLEGPPYPSRAVADNLADIRAQLAANRQGARDLQRLIGRYGLAAVEAYMGYIQQAAETKVRQALRRLAGGTREFVDYLDDGSAICLRLTLHADRAVFDFTGSANVHPGNFNANRAIVTAAILYCLRCLLQEDIPLNEGVLTPVELILPEGLLNPPPGPTPETSPAVVGGNVETSQRIVDVILGALGLAAASQGTMNNLLFGDGSFAYYETICGGAGATPHRAGADAVHTHMTNTRLTDVEVLEMRYPVRVREFCIRRGSGGSGRHRGGDGVVRQLEFLKPLTVSLLSQRRGPYPPYGLASGQPGALGRNTLLRASGETLNLPGCAQLEVQPGDVLVIETPGGGGYG